MNRWSSSGGSEHSIEVEGLVCEGTRDSVIGRVCKVYFLINLGYVLTIGKIGGNFYKRLGRRVDFFEPQGYFVKPRMASGMFPKFRGLSINLWNAGLIYTK
jgi:hypothetical protein